MSLPWNNNFAVTVSVHILHVTEYEHIKSLAKRLTLNGLFKSLCVHLMISIDVKESK